MGLVTLEEEIRDSLPFSFYSPANEDAMSRQPSANQELGSYQTL